MRKNKILTKIIVLTLVTVSIIYASRSVQLNTTYPQEPYYKMDISELQKVVEKRSHNGNLPFDMGLELIKRWSEK